VTVWPLAAAQELSLEYEVKAAFLLNFTKFIEWPASAFSSAHERFRICIAGKDPFGATLAKMIHGERLNSHPLTIEKLQRGRSLHCQMIFFDRSTRSALELIPHLGPGVLTVGETDDFFRIGGEIRFVLENNQVRFDVNQLAVRREGLIISSRLLNVARYVEGGGGE